MADVKVEIEKTSRDATSRAKSSARKPWTPPSSLDAPPPPEGYVHRWIRAYVGNFDDRKNMSSRIREGFELVRAEEYPDFECPTIQDGTHAGVFAVGGLMLARFPIETQTERTNHFSRQTKNQMDAVNNDLMKEQHPAMPISNDRRTGVTFGGVTPDDTKQ